MAGRALAATVQRKSPFARVRAPPERGKVRHGVDADAQVALRAVTVFRASAGRQSVSDSFWLAIASGAFMPRNSCSVLVSRYGSYPARDRRIMPSAKLDRPYPV